MRRTKAGTKLKVRGPDKTLVRLKVNGEEYDVSVEPRRTLLDCLRIDLKMTGAKQGCDAGTCGACTVLLDDKPVYSCLTLAVECDGHDVTTIEGLLGTKEVRALQDAFLTHDAYQCGFCTPAQVVTLYAHLRTNRSSTREDIAKAISGNLCRCGAYQRIVRAGLAAAEILSK